MSNARHRHAGGVSPRVAVWHNEELDEALLRDLTVPTLECPAPTAAELDPAPALRLIPTLTVLYHDDQRRIGERAHLHALLSGNRVALSRIEPLFASVADTTGEPLSDARLSRQPLTLSPTAGGGIRVGCENSRTRVVWRGALWTTDFEISAHEIGQGGILELAGAVALVLHLGTTAEAGGEEDFGLLGEGHAMSAMRREIRRIADLEVPVLIRGETGTGKELVARALHDASRRAEGPFVALNLGAIPSALASAELFGAERGAFTGSVRRQTGYFSLARGGTLFLDEIGEAPPEVQVMLLRAIETGEIHALGAARAQQVQARLIAATDADLQALIRERAFREPLLHRLSGFELRLPPLRERREDIGRLVLHFVREESLRLRELIRLHPEAWPQESVQRSGAPGPPESIRLPGIPLRLMSQLAAFPWPGNVRQLRNAVRQIVLSSRGGESLVLPSALAEQLNTATPSPRTTIPPADATPLLPAALFPGSVPRVKVTPRRKPGDVSEDELKEALERCSGDLKATAAALRISRASLYDRLDKAPHIRTARSLTVEELQRCSAECGGNLETMVQRLRVSRSALQRRLRELLRK